MLSLSHWVSRDSAVKKAQIALERALEAGQSVQPAPKDTSEAVLAARKAIEAAIEEFERVEAAARGQAASATPPTRSR